MPTDEEVQEIIGQPDEKQVESARERNLVAELNRAQRLEYDMMRLEAENRTLRDALKFATDTMSLFDKMFEMWRA